MTSLSASGSGEGAEGKNAPHSAPPGGTTAGFPEKFATGSSPVSPIEVAFLRLAEG